jgi:ABC-type nitrate/sulfonate/bicarbonate transport system permease component
MSTPDHAPSMAAPPTMAPQATPYTGRLRRLTGHWGPAALIVLVLLGIWEGYVRLWAVPKWLLPAPSVITMTVIVSRSLLLDHTLVTLLEVVIGFGLALLCGVLLACGIAASQTLERALYPFVIASQMVPIIVIAPLLLIWVGYGLTPKIIVVALTAFFPIVVNMADGLKSVDPDAVNLLRTMGASRWQIFVKVQVPTSLPFLFSGLRIAMAVSVIGAVIGEWMGSSQGLGYLMIRSKPQFLTERVFAAIVVLSVMGVALFTLVGIVEKLAIPWWHNELRQRSLSQEE